MTSTILSACVKCGDLPTSIVMFSADDYASCAAAFLCKNCAPTVAHNAASVGELRRKGWRVGTTKMKGRPRHLETDPRWKHKPNLQHELIRFYMTHMSHVSAKHMAKRLPQYVPQLARACLCVRGGRLTCSATHVRHRFLLDKIVTQFINSSSRLSSNCARVLRETAFKRTPEVNLRDMGMNDSDMKCVARPRHRPKGGTNAAAVVDSLCACACASANVAATRALCDRAGWWHTSPPATAT